MIHLSDYFQFINESKDNVYSDLSNIIINKFNNNNSFIVNKYSKILDRRK